MNQMTTREAQVLLMIANGLTTKECARWCGCSEQTVKNHILHSCQKLHCLNRVHLVYRALSSAIIAQDTL